MTEIYGGPTPFIKRPARRLLPPVAAVVFLMTSLAFAAACGRSDKSSAGPAPDAAKTKGPVIAVVPMGTTHEFWKAIHSGALAAAREFGAEIIWKGPLREDDRTEQVHIVETLASSGIDALVLTPIDDRALIRPVEDARDAGIPTVIYNSPLESDAQRAYVATDNFKGGVLAAERVGSLLGGRGRVIMLRCTPGVEGTRLREEGFLTTVRAKFPEIAVLSDNQYSGTSTETAYQTMENLLSRFSEFEGLFTPNESSTFGAMRALADHGLSRKVVHVGFDSSAKLVEGLRDGTLRGLVLQDPFGMGYESVKTALAILKGQPYETAVDTGVTLATRENMDTPEVHRLLFPDLTGTGEERKEPAR